MRYSCFDQGTGLYRVFEDASAIPINGDLPIPSLSGVVNGIGVPSVDAARSLPGGARYIGTNWNPIGMIVNCGGGSSGGDVAGIEDFSTGGKTIVLAAILVLGAWIVVKVL